MPRRRSRRVVKEVIVREQRRVQQAPAPRRRRQRQRRGAGAAMRGGGPASRLALSLADPWAVSACIPDGANGVGCFSIKQVNILGTGAGGTACGFILNPQGINNFYKQDSLSTATTLTFTGNYGSAAQAATIQALYSAGRVISAGIKVRYVGNTQTDQGMILIGQVSEQVSPSDFNAATITTAQALMQNYKIVPLRSGARVTWRPQSMDDQQVFFDTASAAAALTASPSVPWLFVGIFGATAATSSLALIDAVVNLEGQFTSQTFLPGGLDVAPPAAESGWYEKALNLVRTLDPIMPFVSSTLTNVFNSPVAGNAMGMLLGTANQRGLPRLNYMQPD